MVLAWELDGEPGGLDGPELARLREALGSQDRGAPDWRRSWLLGYESRRPRDWPVAVRAFTEVIQLAKEPYIGARLEATLSRGAVRIGTGDLARAQGDFAVARALAGGIEPALLLARAFHLDGRTALAEETLGDLHAKAEAGGKDEVALWAAAVYGSLSDPERGLAWAQRLATSPINERLRAFFLFRLKRYREAIVAGNAAVARNPRDPVAHLVLTSALIADLVARGCESPTEAEIARLLEVARAAAELGGNARTDSLLRGAEAVEHDFKARRQAMAASGKGLLWAALALGVGGAAVGQEGYFDEGRPVEGINSFYDGWSPSVTEDGLLLYFSSGRPGGAGGHNIWVATRLRREDQFGTPVPVAELNTAFNEYNPNISADGLKIYFDSDQVTGGGAGDIYVATREDRRLAFGNIQPLRGVETAGWEADATLSADGKLYFTRFGRGYADLYVASWSAEEGAFVNVRPLTEINTAYGEGNSCVSKDARTLFWSRWHPSPPDWYIWMATLNEAGELENPRPVKPPSGDAWATLCPWISYDWPAPGSKIYYTRRSLGASEGDIWEATWHPAPRFRSGDANDDGSIDLSDVVGTLIDLFLGTHAVSCRKAADANDDGAVDISDAVFLLSYPFLGGKAPEEPPGSCGVDPTPDDLTCESFRACEQARR